MANLTIENIGGFLKSGNIESTLDHGMSIQSPQAPEIPDLQGLQGGDDVGGTAKTFGQLLDKSLKDLNDSQLQADKAVKELAAGRNKNIHETMLLLEKADMSFRMAMQVRNKVIEAYREVMRMQV